METGMRVPGPEAAPSFRALVLSDPSAVDRRRRISAMMEQIARPFDWRFFDIVPAERLPVAYDERATYDAYGSAMSKAEISCATSHLTMIQSFLDDNDCEYLMVLEDDVALDPYFRFAAAVNFMKLTELDYFKLYARYFTPAKFIYSFARLAIYRGMWPPLGAQCYLLSRAGARRILDHVHAMGRLDYPVDVILDQYWNTGLPVVMLYPFPAMELAHPTTLHSPTSRSQVDEANARLKAELGPRPDRWSKLRERIQRTRENRRLKAFDKAFAARIRANIDEIYRGFFR